MMALKPDEVGGVLYNFMAFCLSLRMQAKDVC